MADLELILFRRQYRQLFEPDFLSWPPLALLRNDDAQAWLFRNLFDSSRSRYLPPWQYQLCVLEVLVRRIAKAVQGGGVVHCTTDLRLTAHLGHLRQTHQQGSATTTVQPAQVESYITFSCFPGGAAQNNPDGNPDLIGEEPTVTLLERRNLVVGSKVTGYRTWEGCMHLATFLLACDGTLQQKKGHIRGKRVLELGAGTGFLSILCAKHLGVEHVLSTDGDEHVVEALQENVKLNAAQSDETSSDLPVTARVLRWGEKLDNQSWVYNECSQRSFDVVLGADITYDKDAVVLLAFTLNELLKLQPQLEVLIAGVVRRADSFELFLSECRRFGFVVTEMDFRAKPMREQKALFYAAAMPLKILSIRGPKFTVAEQLGAFQT